jgi:hypothetical protein
MRCMSVLGANDLLCQSRQRNEVSLDQPSVRAPPPRSSLVLIGES